MEGSISTVVFRSNVYPVVKNFYEDPVFRSKIHDPFSLEVLKKGYKLTLLQKQEFQYASLHCTYAAKDDYPWGTIRDECGQERVVCKCLNTECAYFQSCVPDFDPALLLVHEENRKAQFAIHKFDASKQNEQPIDNGDEVAAEKLFEGIKVFDESNMTPKLIIHDQINPFIVKEQTKSTPIAEESDKIDFSSFVESTQEDIIEAESTEQSIINAGPGTGKTWTLIEKIIYMISNKEVQANNVLVMCFSRSAVEVVRSRLADAADSGRIGYDWRDVDVRTFDSFSTYLIAWVQDNHPELLPRHYLLEANDYDQRIKTATSIFKNMQNILESYDHIIIDEVQDLVGSRAELVLAMLKSLSETCGFTVLGDSCQALYDYMAEDDPTIMSSEQFYLEIFKNFPNANYLTLTENHRQGDKFSDLTIPYRNAILSGTPKERVTVAGNLLTKIPSLPVKLHKFSKKDAMHYVQQGTLGILTRTNGQALQISAWLRNEDVPHSLQRGLGAPTLGDWIVKIFYDYENESIDEITFMTRHLSVFPGIEYETIVKRWGALVSTLYGDTKKRYEVSDLLKGLLRNAKEPMLFESSSDTNYTITVSNIHRAKGKEFDSVIVVDDVIEAMADPNTDNILEHKVCYVALTRPKKQIVRSEMSKRDKQIYITRNLDNSNRCAKASGFKKRYISHIEIGSDMDIDMKSIANSEERQTYLLNCLHSGMRIKLIKCPEGTNSHVTYKVVLEDNESIILGYTSKSFAIELEKAIQHIMNMNCSVWHSVYPHAFINVYVNSITTCISSLPSVPVGAKKFGEVSIWAGMTITGFAAVDKDTY